MAAVPSPCQDSCSCYHRLYIHANTLVSAIKSIPTPNSISRCLLQLPGLSTLILAMEGVGNEPWAGRDIAWRAIALMPNLSKLKVKFRDPDDDESWIYLSDLSALQPLGGRLQHLEVCCGALHSDALQNFTFLSGLTGRPSRGPALPLSCAQALQPIQICHHFVNNKTHGPADWR